MRDVLWHGQVDTVAKVSPGDLGATACGTCLIEIGAKFGNFRQHQSPLQPSGVDNPQSQHGEGRVGVKKKDPTRARICTIAYIFQIRTNAKVYHVERSSPRCRC